MAKDINTPGLRPLVSIEPYQLWTIKTLSRFKIITKDEVGVLLEQYLESTNKIKANINKHSEKESDDYLVTLEPTNWKEQDHYLVLGLQHLRYRATDDDIRRAHRRKALKHHPDKRGKSDKTDLESDYYSCITRAMEVLGDATKRRSFDSVDPTFDDSIPNPIKAAKLEKDPKLFYKTFCPAFELNSRWSTKTHVPLLGSEQSPRQQVENFYEFWYNFQTWREFSYLDEEDKDKGENRDERRWLDRQNKAARQQRRKAEIQRLRQLVDNAYMCDPRVSKFKVEDKQRKLDIKKAKKEEVQMRIEKEAAERARIEEEEKKVQVAQEEEEKKKKLEDKKQREQAKKDTKRAVKGLEEIFKDNDYFISNPRDKIKHIEELDKLTKMLSLTEIRDFRQEFESNQDFSSRQKLFLDKVNNMNEKIEEEKRKQMTKTTTNTNGNTNGDANKEPNWTEDEIRMLVKAVSTFPAGTKDRWDTIADHMAQHSSGGVKRTPKQILGKVKQIQEQLTRRK